MKIFLTLLLFSAASAQAATCTTTSRTNYSTGQVLTSAALNADFNQLVTKANALDAGCLTDGTLEAAALNSTDFAAVTNGIQQGCAVSYSDANTLSIGKCILSVNGNFVKTATANTVTWGCTGCAAEVVSTQYYLYAKSGSTGTTLTPLISTTVPGGDGYDGSGNKILGKFYNNSSSNIDTSSAVTWSTDRFLPSTDAGLSSPIDSFMFSFGGAGYNTSCSSSPCGFLDQLRSYVSSVTITGTGVYQFNFARTYAKIRCIAEAGIGNVLLNHDPIYGTATNSVGMITVLPEAPYSASNAYATVKCEGY